MRLVENRVIKLKCQMSQIFFCFLFYSASAVLYAIGILWNAEGQATTETENDSFTSFNSFGGKAKFLTHINMVRFIYHNRLAIHTESISV